MKPFRTAALLAAFAASALLPAHAGPAPQPQVLPKVQDEAVLVPPERGDRPSIEVTFVLDTTSSMAGLIEGAKNKIWSIASRIARGKPTPRLKVGLVAYRDVGDEYVTRRFDLTPDLDSVYLNLRKLQAEGGGDGPEHVGRALGEAVSRISWSQDPKTLKMIFLVGDAPPHDDYRDGWNSRTWARKAIRKGIVVNTVRCGDDSDTEVAWRAISRLADGSFTSIGQSGGMVAMKTPYDEKLAKLNAEIASKTVYAGERRAREEAKGRAEAVAALPASVAADRMGYLATTGAGKGGGGLAAAPAAVHGSKDLTAEPASLEGIGNEELPEELQRMDKAQQKAHLARLASERKELEQQVLEATKERDAWMAKNAGEKADSFDAKVMDDVKAKAARIGVAY